MTLSGQLDLPFAKRHLQVMKFWFFRFEGVFRADAPEHCGKGVFSNCLVPLANYAAATALMNEALAYYGIDLIEVMEREELDPQEWDANDPDNKQWFEWCEEAKADGTIVFDPWYLFELE